VGEGEAQGRVYVSLSGCLLRPQSVACGLLLEDVTALRCLYLYFCTSKASKLSTAEPLEPSVTRQRARGLLRGQRAESC